jgi:alkylation response protein AidB-like acyl-CoA dehydrogenase
LPDGIWPDTTRLTAPDITELIARNASAGDRTGRLADESVNALRQSGFFGAPVPRQFEGAGASLAECCALQRRLGAADPALAVAVNMHLFSVGVAVEHWRRERDASWLLLEAIATQSRLVASAFAEPGLGGSLVRSTCRSERVDDGYIVRGVKSPCSLVQRSDLVCLQFEADDPGRGRRLKVALIPTATPGCRTQRTWDALGMRSSESDTLHLDGCHIPDDLVFHDSDVGQDDDPVFSAGIVWFCAATTATYAGLVGAALQFAAEALRRSRLEHLDSSRADLVSSQIGLGEIAGELLTIEAACLGVATRFAVDQDRAVQLVPTAVALKDRCADFAARAVAAAMRLVGSRSYASESPLARLLRDAHAATYHPPTRVPTHQSLGRWVLGMRYSLELDEPTPSDRHNAETSLEMGRTR